LALTEKKMNRRLMRWLTTRGKSYPSPDSDAAEKEEKLDLILTKNPWLAHIFLFDENDAVVRSQPGTLSDKIIRDENERILEGYHTWFTHEAKSMVENLHKKPQQILFFKHADEAR